jgi:hypothetical protein
MEFPVRAPFAGRIGEFWFLLEARQRTHHTWGKGNLGLDWHRGPEMVYLEDERMPAAADVVSRVAVRAS